MAWVDIAKPATSSYTDVSKPEGAGIIGVGYAFGTLGMTYSDQIFISLWVDVAKPTTSAWVDISKPT